MEWSSRTWKPYVLHASFTIKTDSRPSETTEHAVCYCDCDRVVLQDGAQPARLQTSNAPRNVHDNIRHNRYKRISALARR